MSERGDKETSAREAERMRLFRETYIAVLASPRSFRYTYESYAHQAVAEFDKAFPPAKSTENTT